MSKIKRHRSHESHFQAVAQLPCVVSGFKPAILHHCRSGSLKNIGIHVGKQRPSDWLVIPVAPVYHTGRHGIHQIGVGTWEKRYGTQVAHLRRVSEILGYDVIERYRAEGMDVL